MPYYDTQKIIEEQQRRIRMLEEALKKIAAIQDKTDGGDWDEIEEARKIAAAALNTTRKD